MAKDAPAAQLFVPSSSVPSTSSSSTSSGMASGSSSTSSLLRRGSGRSAAAAAAAAAAATATATAAAATATADMHKKRDGSGTTNGRDKDTEKEKEGARSTKPQQHHDPQGGREALPSTKTTKTTTTAYTSTTRSDDAQKLRWRDLTRLQPWVLVPQGSINGYFDYVPLHWRIGPWSLTAQIYLLVIVGAVIAAPHYWLHKDPDSFTNYLERISAVRYDDPEMMPMEPRHAFLYNLVASAWMVGSMAHLLSTSPLHIKIWATYTIQSWTMLSFRHVMSALAYVYPTSSPHVVMLAELSRFPAACSASITFGVWNALVMPFIYYVMRVPEKRQAFVKFCFSPRLLNIHGLNIVLAIMNGAYASPRRSLVPWDFYLAFVSVVVYMAFYLLVLDRIGVHLYAVFSPRAPSGVVVLTWTLLIGVYAATFMAWKHVMTIPAHPNNL
jgi:hypothetical protein